MRRLFLLAVALAPTAAPAAPMEITRVEDCAPAVAADPSAAREQAAIWYRLGGGTAPDCARLRRWRRSAPMPPPRNF